MAKAHNPISKENLMINAYTLRDAYHQAFDVKNEPMINLLEQQYQITQHLLARKFKMAIKAIGSGKSVKLHDDFPIVDAENDYLLCPELPDIDSDDEIDLVHTIETEELPREAYQTLGIDYELEMAKRRKQEELENKMKKLKEERLNKERKERNRRLKHIKERILKYNAEWLEKNGHMYGFHDLPDDVDSGCKTVTTFTQTTDPTLPESRVFYVPEVVETRDTGTQTGIKAGSFFGGEEKSGIEKDGNEQKTKLGSDHGSKAKGKAVDGARSSDDFKDEDKEAGETRLKYGVCPDCSRNYGKDLRRHLRTVEKWTEERIEKTYKKGIPKVDSNPYRPCPFANCDRWIKNYIAHFKTHGVTRKENPELYKKMLHKMQDNFKLKQQTATKTTSKS